MKKSDQLKQLRSQKLDAQKVILDAAKAENRELTDAENTQLDAMDAEVADFDSQIERAIKAEERELRIAEANGSAPAGGATGGSENREHAKMKAKYSLHRALRSQLPNGKLDGVEREIHDETVKRAKDAGIVLEGLAVPTASRADGQTVTQDSGGYGANLVSTETQSPIEFLRPQPILESLGARFITDLQGNVKFPTNDGGISASWEGEVAEVASTKNAYGSKTMTPKRLAVSVPIALQNLMQSSVGLEMFTIEDMRNAIANAIDTAGINGSGSSNQPTGILNTSGIGSVVGGTNGAAPTWAHIVGLETSVFVNNANSAKMNYLVNPVTKGKLKVTAHEANASNYLMNPDGTINGYNAGVSNLIPSNLTKGSASGICSAGIFGDFSQLIIGQWAFLDLSVDNFSRKREGYVEITMNTFLDIMLRQPKAFAVIKDWLTT